MAQITFTDLAAQLPVGTLTETVDDVQISLKALMGETSVQLADDKVIELMAKLGQAGYNSQVAFNAVVGNDDISAFSAPFPGSIVTIAGVLYVPIQQSFNFISPVGIDAAIGVQV
jgi:hypothetical protein